MIGTGAVGASWAALFLAHGLDVIAYDTAFGAQECAGEFITQAWPALVELGHAKSAEPPLHRLRFVDSPGEAARAADLVQENTPERPQEKAAVLAELDASATAEKIILSSTGGLPPSELQAPLKHPERFVVMHPFNPSHLIPLVEVVGGRQTSPEVVQWGLDFARYLGKKPIRLNAEANGHMTNRLQFALVREAVQCLLDGIASATDIDAAVRYGLGPRWTLMGSLLTVHMAGGPGGMEGILDHAGAAIEDWWTPHGQPHLTPEVKARLVQAAREVSVGQPTGDWAAWRDRCLIDLLKLQSRSESLAPSQTAKEQL